jgi:hypothetical protein
MIFLILINLRFYINNNYSIINVGRFIPSNSNINNLLNST